MAKYWRAKWRPISVNFTKGGNQPKLMVVHIMEGTLAGTDSWFHNPASDVSAHFGVGKDGTIYQWVDTNDQAWHACAANDHSIGVENEGSSGDKLTAAQILSNARILRWAHRKHPLLNLWLNIRPETGSGLSYHGLGGVAWCNHPQCPGDPIVAQLPAILEKAKTL
jgi:hypothetical protein